MRFAVLLSPFVFLAAACGGETRTASVEEPCGVNGVVISDAWMRPAREGQPTGAAYLKLCNGTAIDDALVGASFAGADATELHVTSMSGDNMASMAPSKEIAIASGGEAVLEPGGAHIMLIGLTGAVEPGDDPVITLKFKNAAPVDIVFDVRNEEMEDHAHH